MPIATAASRRRLPVALLLGALLGVSAACTRVTIDPELAPAPPPPAPLVVVGEIAAPGPDSVRAARRFRRDLAAALAGHQPVGAVTTRPPLPLPADALVVSGRFTEIDPGSEATRLLVGFGAGQPSLAAAITVADASGRPLLRFTQEAQPADGRGWDAHWAPFDLDDGIGAFAEDAAAVIADWLRGERP